MLYKPGKSSAKVAKRGHHHGGKLHKQQQIKQQEDLQAQSQTQHNTMWSRFSHIFSAISHLSLFGSHQNVTNTTVDKGAATSAKESELNQQQHCRHRKPSKDSKNERSLIAASCDNLASTSAAFTSEHITGCTLGSTFSMDEEEQPSAVNRVAKWATGLSHLLCDPNGVRIFTEFLLGEFSEENINFWLLVEEFKTLENPDKLLSCAQQICRMHIDCDGPASVNLDCTTVRDLQSRLHLSSKHSPPERCLFDTAQDHIFNLMRLDSYPRFLKSNLYKDCLLCELESGCSEISQIPAPKIEQQIGGRRKSRDMRLLPPDQAFRRNRKPSLIVAALDLDSSKC